MAKDFLIYEEVEVPAGKTRSVPHAGDFLLIEECSRKFKLQFGSADSSNVKAGFKFQGRKFDKLNLTNLSSDKALRVALWIGSGNIDYIYTREAPTFTIGGTIQLPSAPGAGDSVANLSRTRPGVVDGFRRKYIVATNPSTDIDVYARRVSDDAIIGIVFPRTARVFETDDDLNFWSDVGEVTDLFIEEEFYL